MQGLSCCSYKQEYSPVDETLNQRPSHALISEPHHEKTCLMPYANNKGADQWMHSLINAFVVHCLDSKISLVPTFAIS